MSFQFFTSSQNGTVLSQGPTAGGERPKARGEDKQTSLPVTVRAIETALQGDELNFYGSQPEHLILVGSIDSISKQPTSLHLVVNDATGRIRVRQFLSGDAADVQHDGLEVGRYVHMFGQARSKPEPHFVAQDIRPVRSADEVSFHTIEAAHAALRLQHGSLAGSQALTTPMKTQAPPNADLAVSTFTPPKAQEPAAAKAPELVRNAAAPTNLTHALAAAAAPSGAALRESLMAFLEKEGETKGDLGCSRTEVCAHFKASEAEVNALLSEMVNDGDAMTTIDDDHFAAVV